MVDMSGREKSIRVLREVWEDFRQQTVVGKYSSEQLAIAKEHNFLRTLDDALHYEDNMSSLTIDFRTLRLCYIFCRATKLKLDENNIPLTRFLPMSEYIEDHNRFSPKGVEYLYLGCKFIASGKKYEDVEKLCLKEIDSQIGDRIGICRFEIPKYLCGDLIYPNNYKVIDLSLFDSYSFEEIENEVENSQSKDSLNKALFKLYMKLLSSELFKKVENVRKELEYSPFHCLSYYFKSLGFHGIIYKSRVHEDITVKNIVLFDKNYANPLDYKVKECN